MGGRSTIHGVVMARDEWPLLELSVTHALLHHVDRVWVIDHGSVDGTAEGLRRLNAAWGNRLTSIRLDAMPFLQEAITILLLEVVKPRPEDWVYVFDADEFAITPSAASLRDMLAQVKPEHRSVRYQVDNWVVPKDFDDIDCGQYAGLHRRAIPNLFLDLGPEVTSDEIRRGVMNFFDVPFASKVIIRGGSGEWLAAGAHLLKPHSPAHEAAIAPEHFRVAHFPLLSRTRLQLKVRQGRDLIALGFPPSHGWQSQMLARIDSSGLLEEFWSRHSVDSDADMDHGCRPTTVQDHTFARAMHTTLARLQENRRNRESVVPRQQPPAEGDATFLLSAAVRAIRTLQSTVETLAGQHRIAVAERSAARDDSEEIVANKDAVVQSCGERHQAVAYAPCAVSGGVERPNASEIARSRKIFGIGWAKTGTTTLGACFEILGLSFQGPDLSLIESLRDGDVTRIMDLARQKQAFADWPWPILFRELDEAFPGSLFVLTTRSPQRWLRSYRNMLASQGLASSAMNEVRSILYGLPFPNVTDGQLLERVQRHNAAVRQYFSGRADDLLVVDWEAGSGWRELCEFLGMDIPGQPFPWANQGHYEGHVGSEASRRDANESRGTDATP